jgi:hypothetical protein
MRQLFTRVAVAVVISQFAPGAALAAPIIYSEISGDLSGQNVGTLDVGLNTIQGQFCTSSDVPCAGLSSTDFDSFRFHLPSGLVLNNTTFTFLTTVLPGTTVANTAYNLRDFDADLTLASADINLIPSGSSSQFSSALPISAAGEYQIFHAQLGKNGPGFFVDYTWTLDVSQASQISEPASLALLGIGLAGLGFNRRKRSAK